MTTRVDATFIEVIGLPAMIALAENFGGTRLYVPSKMLPDHEIVFAIGMAAAEKLRARCSPDTIRVPLLRAERALHYRAKGLSNARIAVKLGMTEPGVNRLFQRCAVERKKPA